MKILIIGGGVVGQAVFRTYVEQHDCSVWDVIPERCTHGGTYRPDLADLVFICVPETALDTLFTQLRGTNCHYVLRSTVQVGTTSRLSDYYRVPNIVHSPEFLTERCAVADAMMPTRNIIGSRRRDDILMPPRNNTARRLYELYVTRFPGIPCIGMTCEESEYVKIAQNTLFAITVSMWNELRSLSDGLNLDWDAVRNAILADGRISHNHTQVPGPDGHRGFGGKCLPKDLAHFVDCQRRVNVKSSIAQAAYNRNEVDRRRK